jgi:hypothetical protein
MTGAIDNPVLARTVITWHGVLKVGAGPISGAAPSRKVVAAGANPASLNMLYITSATDSDAVKAALPDFKGTAGFDINYDTMPYNALQRKAFAELASGSPYYDIMIVDTPWMPAQTDKIEPIADMALDSALSAGLNIKNFIPKVFFRHGSIQTRRRQPAFRQDRRHRLRGDQGRRLRHFRTADAGQCPDARLPQEPLHGPRQTRLGCDSGGGRRRLGDWATDDFKTLPAGFGGNGHLVKDKFETRSTRLNLKMPNLQLQIMAL